MAIGGLRPDWTPEAVIFSAINADGPEPPFRIHVRIGKPITPTGDPHLDLEHLRSAVANLMQNIPGLAPGATGIRTRHSQDDAINQRQFRRL